MAIGDLVTDDWTCEFGGQLWGGSSPIGISSIEGLGDMPGLVSADRDRLRRHGRIAGDDFLTERSVMISFQIEGRSTQETFEAVTAFADATQPAQPEQPFVFQIPGIADGLKARIGARVRAKSLPTNLNYRVGIVTAQLHLVATDPRIYDAVDTVESVGLPSSDGGLSWPAQWPAVWSGTTERGGLLVHNNGNFQAPWTARIVGPCTNPVIRNLRTGQLLGFNIVLDSGEFLEVDSDRRTVRFMGTASRYHTMIPQSSWWDMSPGVTELAFSAASGGNPELVVTSRSAWTG